MASNYGVAALPIIDHPISKLSVDHFSIIVKFLDEQDIRSARLAGRELHFFLSPYVFKSIRFTPHRECLDMLKTVSQNDVFSRSVKTLRYDTSLFQLPMVWDELDDWDTSRLRRKYPWQTIRRIYHSSPGVQLQDLEEYAEFVAEQSSIDNNLERHLNHVLDTFPGISTIVFTNSSTKSSTRFKDLLQENSHSRRWIRSSQFFSLINAISKSRCKITKISVDGYWSLERFPDNRDFGDDSHVPGSIKYAFPDFEHARCWKEMKPSIVSTTFDLTSKNLSIVKPIFNNLTHLSLGITSIVPLEELDMSPSLVPESYWSALPEVLKSLSNITHLSLDLKVCRHVDQQLEWIYYHDDITELFNDPPLTLSRLTSLKLTQFRSCGPSLLSLLQRHSNIDDLTMRNVIEIRSQEMWVNPYLIGRQSGPKWIELVETMRELRLQRLDLCGLEGFGCNFLVAGSENTNLVLARIHDYILHGYGDNPLGPNVDANNWDAKLW